MSIVVFTDGGARNNPGPAGAGVVIYEDGEKKVEMAHYLGEKQTNNWAEYEAVIIALGKLLEMGLRDHDIQFKLDSQLVVEQIKGNWKIKEPTLRSQVEKVHGLLKDFGKVTFTHIPREENEEADKLVNEAIDSA
jgi:ribonuclease HI